MRLRARRQDKNKMSIIELKEVTKEYKMGDVIVRALDGLNIKIKKGEFVAIMGPSGSGKSTIMNMIGCLDLPNKGNIFLNAKNIGHMHESKLASIRGKEIGFIFQQFNLINTLSILENVMLPMVFQNIPLDDRIQKARKLLEMVGLSKRMKHKPNELSGGEQQRVAIARALANDPEIILADEPTGNLDSKTGNEIMEFLKKLNKQGKTVIVVTHDANLAKYAQRIIHLRDGRVAR